MPAHHPDDALLLEYASGAMPQSVALAVATHVGACARCQATTTGLEAVGGACLDDIAPAQMSADALDSIFAELDNGTYVEPPAPPRAPGVPSPLDQYLPVGFEDLPWKGRAGSIRTFDLDIADQRTFLLHIPAGVKSPSHTHRGKEYTQVVQGAFTDDSGEYRDGDFIVTDGTVTHKPMVTGAEACICLAVLEAPIKLSGPLGWIINPFLR